MRQSGDPSLGLDSGDSSLPVDAVDPSLRLASDEPSSGDGDVVGGLTFESPEAQVQRTAELLGAGVLVVVAAPAPGFVRGRLAEHLDDLVERELGARGAPSPYMAAWAAMPDDGEARLADQLFRARSVGATGLAIALGSLTAIARPTLSPEDSETLRVLARASKSGPLFVMMDDGDEALPSYSAPLPVLSMLGMLDLALPPPSAPEEHLEAAPPEAPEPPNEAPHLDPHSITHVDAPVSLTADPHSLSPVPVPVPVPVPDPITIPDPPHPSTIGIPVAGPSDAWRSWAIALGAARGPQSLAVFERLFVESYMPLSNAIALGLDDPRALRAHDDFRRAFERSYTDAFATFGATGRRPRLVMDVFDLASKQARLHNARTSHVLVVDAMRHDVGAMVRDGIAARAAGVASLTSETMLWSALPTTTFRQLETLARGMDALRAPAEEASDVSMPSLRGKSAETVRRLRVGSRELFKLDVVPSMLGALSEGGAGSPRSGAERVIDGLEDIASTITESLLRHVETLHTRTLLLVVGDHGFSVDRRGRVSHGGASPEEVLVPAFAYLIGDLH